MKTEKFLVVVGRDSENKSRAAKFDEKDEKAARKIAAVHGFKIAHPKTDEAVALATRLVDGKVFASGKGLVPLVNAETYEKLLKLLEIEDPKTDAVTVKASPAPAASTDPWLKIVVGSIVLCPNDGKGRTKSWWECMVTGISSDTKTLTLKWNFYPEEKPFTVKRNAVALLPSKG